MKKVILGLEARKKLKEGIDLCADVVKVSMGGHGRNVAIYNGVTTEVINDGVSIAREVNQKDEILQAGIQLAKQCAEKTDRDAGDGTTTTIVLLQAILKEIITDLQAESPRTTREKLYKEAEAVIGRLNPTEVKTKEDIYNIALTSCLDEEVAKVLSLIFDKLGNTAKVTVQEVNDDRLEYEVVEGMQFETKNLTDSILKTQEEKVTLENVHVMYLEKAETTEKIQERINNSGGLKEMVVIANQFTRPVLLALMNPNIRIFPLQNKEMNNNEDIPAYIGETEPVTKVIITKDNVTLIGGKGDVKTHVEALKKRKDEAESEYDKELIDKRIASLTSGVGVVKIGKATDAERGEAVLKVEDAINAVKSAMEAGYVKGGGRALMEAGKGGVLEKVCEAPHKQIVENGGDENIPGTVIDSYKSVKHSLLNALSTACSVLTVEAMLVEEKEEEV